MLALDPEAGVWEGGLVLHLDPVHAGVRRPPPAPLEDVLDRPILTLEDGLQVPSREVPNPSRQPQVDRDVGA